MSRRESWDPFYESPPPNFVPVSTQNFAKGNYLKLLFSSLRCIYTQLFHSNLPQPIPVTCFKHKFDSLSTSSNTLNIGRDFDRC
jgi:hypothetical protein